MRQQWKLLLRERAGWQPGIPGARSLEFFDFSTVCRDSWCRWAQGCGSPTGDTQTAPSAEAAALLATLPLQRPPNLFVAAQLDVTDQTPPGSLSMKDAEARLNTR